MSVELSSPSVSPKTVASAEGRGGVGKSKVGASQTAGDAAPGGFMALLAAFDEPESLTSLPGDVATDVPGSLVVPTTTPDKAEVVDVLWSELSMLLGQKMPPDLQAQVTPNAQDQATAFVAPEAQVLVTAQMLVNTQMPSEGPALAEAGEAALSGANTSLAAPYQPAGKPLPLSNPKASVLSAVDPIALKTTAEGLVPDMATQGLAVPNRKTGSSAQSLLAVSSATELRALKPTTFMDLVAKEPALSGALLTSGLGAEVINLAARGANRSISGVGTFGVEGAFAQHALTPGGSADVANVAAGAALSPESAVAEQVTYWVSQGVQNAQLKLDGFGAEPVEVTISLNGQEAQIDFRTDQPEVRQMLEGALTQLKETLAKEGLVLSGVSVGASGQEGAGAQDRRQRPSTRQATVATPEAGPTAGLQRASPVAGRALDVFV